MTDTEKLHLANEIRTAIAFESPGGELDDRTAPAIQALLDDAAYLERHPLPPRPGTIAAAQWITDATLEVLARLGQTVQAAEKDAIPTAGHTEKGGKTFGPPPLPMPF